MINWLNLFVDLNNKELNNLGWTGALFSYIHIEEFKILYSDINNIYGIIIGYKLQTLQYLNKLFQRIEVYTNL